MGDRCWLRIEFPRKDLEKFNEIMDGYSYEGRWWDVDDGDEQWVCATIDEANYGLCNEINEMANAGLTFAVEHGTGSSYGPMAYACFKGKLEECNTDYDGTPVVRYYDHGIDLEDLRAVMEYYGVLGKVKELKNHAQKNISRKN